MCEGCGVGCANCGCAVELMTFIRNDRCRAYGVIRSLLSRSLRSVAIAGVDGGPGTKKRGQGRGGNAGIGVNMAEIAGDDCATDGERTEKRHDDGYVEATSLGATELSEPQNQWTTCEGQ